MNRPSINRERPPSANWKDNRISKWVLPWLSAITSDPDLLAIALFCVIGLLIALNLMFRFPDYGALFEQYNQF
jgi:hypothetical protein